MTPRGAVSFVRTTDCDDRATRNRAAPSTNWVDWVYPEREIAAVLSARRCIHGCSKAKLSIQQRREQKDRVAVTKIRMYGVE